MLWYISIPKFTRFDGFLRSYTSRLCSIVLHHNIIYACNVFDLEYEMRLVFFVSRDFKKNKYLSYDRFRFGNLSFQVPTDCHVQALLYVYSGTVIIAASRIYCSHCFYGIVDLRTYPAHLNTVEMVFFILI